MWCSRQQKSRRCSELSCQIQSWVDIFYAEKVWQEIVSLAERDALQMEEDLAKLADLIIVIVESAGTLTELGVAAS